MSQVCIYLDPPAMGKLRDCAASEGLSLSKYVSQLIESAAPPKKAWPEEFWALHGCLTDGNFPDIEDIPALDPNDVYDDFARR